MEDLVKIENLVIKEIMTLIKKRKTISSEPSSELSQHPYPVLFRKS
jgi:hypothetical protein